MTKILTLRPHRIAEELDKRTDVRASGMHGFYANLLNKNVSMGGDVSNAVSAYTAGSNRQSALLVEADAAGNDVSKQKDLTKIESGTVVAETALSTTGHAEVSQTDKLDTDNEIVIGAKRPREDESVSDAVLAEPAALKPQDRESKISSARERYLARKTQT
jgi:hypothetical protein